MSDPRSQTWFQLHQESLKFAEDAQDFRNSGDEEAAQAFFRKAAEAENEALRKFIDSNKNTKPKTIGILYVGLSSLLYNSYDFSQSERIALEALGNVVIPDVYKYQLRVIIQTIWNEMARSSSGIRFAPGEVVVSVSGGEIVTGGAPLDLIVDKVQNIQHLYQRTTEFMLGIEFRKSGSASKRVKDQCTPWLFQMGPGSYQFSVAIKEPEQKDFFDNEIVDPKKIADKFLKILKSCSTENNEAFENLVQSPDYRKSFLTLARGLAPTGDRFQNISLKNINSTNDVNLSVETRSLLNNKIKKERKNQKENNGEKDEVVLKGILRALDLDQDWLSLDTEQGKMKIIGISDTVDDMIGEYVNREVKVTVFKSNNELHYIDIEN